MSRSYARSSRMPGRGELTPEENVGEGSVLAEGCERLDDKPIEGGNHKGCFRRLAPLLSNVVVKPGWKRRTS